MTSIEHIATTNASGQAGGQKPAGRTGASGDAQGRNSAAAQGLNGFVNFLATQINTGKLTQDDLPGDMKLDDLRAILANLRQQGAPGLQGAQGTQNGQRPPPAQGQGTDTPADPLAQLAQLAQILIQDENFVQSLPGQLPAGMRQLLASFSQQPAALPQPPATDTTGIVQQNVNVTATNGSAENGQTPRTGGVGAGGILDSGQNGQMSSAAEMRAEIKAQAQMQAQAQKGQAPANNHAPHHHSPAQNAPDITTPAPTPQNGASGQAHIKAEGGFMNSMNSWFGGDMSSGTSGGNAGGYGTDGFMNGSGQQHTLHGRGVHGAHHGQGFGQYLAASGGKPSPALQTLKLQIQRGMDAKIDSMTVKLQPASLGKVDVKLQFGDDGAMKAHLSVEKPETLTLLQKDSHSLERMLQDAGISLDDNALSFSLQHGATDERQAFETFKGKGKGGEIAAAGETETIETDIAAFMNGGPDRTGIDLLV